MGRRGKGRLRGALVAPLEAVGEVSGDLVPQARSRGRKGGSTVDHGGERAVGDLDALRRIEGGTLALGDDEGDRVADMADALACQRVARRGQQRVEHLHGRYARQRADAVRAQIGLGEDAAHARDQPGRSCVDALDHGMRVRRAQHVRMELAGDGQIVEQSGRVR